MGDQSDGINRIDTVFGDLQQSQSKLEPLMCYEACLFYLLARCATLIVGNSRPPPMMLREGYRDFLSLCDPRFSPLRALSVLPFPSSSRLVLLDWFVVRLALCCFFVGPPYKSVGSLVSACTSLALKFTYFHDHWVS